MRDDTFARLETTAGLLTESLVDLRDSSEPDMPPHFTREDILTAWMIALFIEFRVVANHLGETDVLETVAQLEQRIADGLKA